MSRSTVLRPLLVSLLAVEPLYAQARPSSSILDSITFAPALGVDLLQSERVNASLYRRDVIVGTGANLRPAATVTLRIRSRRADGSAVDTIATLVTIEWRPGVFAAAIERGVRGMRVGGRRQLVLAPGAGGGLPADVVVVVDVELLRIN